MGRRIRWLGVIMVVLLGLVVAQLVNIQLVKAKQLQNSPNNPRIANIYAVGCGPDVDTDTLRAITDIVLMMPDMSPE